MPETLRIDIPITAQDKTSSGLRSAQRALTAFEKVLERVDKALDRFDRKYEIDLEANDGASGKVKAAQDAVDNFAGTNGTANIGVSDNASSIVDAARDKVESFGGASGSADIGANDNASSVLDAVMDKARSWAGTAWNATVGVVDTVTSPLTKLGGAIRSPLAKGAAALGLGMGVTDVIDTYKEFEAQMSEVSAISGATGAALDSLTAKAQEMGATTKFTATEAGEAFSYMAMAGWKTNDMLDGIEGIMNLAAASGENLGSVSDIVTDALTAFGMAAKNSGHFADVLAQASINANTDVGIMGESFKYVAPVAGALGYSVEDTSLALGLMANASVKGSMAGTALKTSLANLAAPSEKMATYMDKYHISLTGADGEMLSLIEVIEQLRGRMGGLSEAEQTAAASAIFGKEAMSGMLAIINASEESYNQLKDAVYDADGASKRMSETMMDNLEGSLIVMNNAVEGLKMSLGSRLAPYVQGVAEMITGAVPGVTKALGGLMDYVDGITDSVKTKFKTLSYSDEFRNADLFGKVNIAWNKVVAEPFTKWAGGKGKTLVGNALGGLFEEAGKLMPGGEEAGPLSWLSAGLIAKGATTAVSGIGKLVSAISGISPVAGIAAGGAIGLATAIGAISLAIDTYNQKQISNSLSEHFGDIQLSAKEAKEAAETILNMDYLVDIDFAINEYNNADELATEAETYLKENEEILWNARISGVNLTTDDLTTYKDNIDQYLRVKQQELNQRSHAVYVHVDTIVGHTATGDKFRDLVQGWAESDNKEMADLQAQMTALVEQAMTTGIDDVNVQAAIDSLTEKINEIESGWKAATAQAEFDLLSQKAMSGAGLTADSYEAIVDQLHSYMDQEQAALDAASKQVYATINARDARGEFEGTGMTATEARKEWANSERNRRAETRVRGVSFMDNTIMATYGDMLGQGREKYREEQNAYLDQLMKDMEEGFGLSTDMIERRLSEAANVLADFDFTDFMDANGNYFESGDVGAMNKLLEMSLPDVEDMRALIDEYIKNNQAIPQELYDAYYSMMENYAATGDSSAINALIAQKLLDPSNTSELSEMIRNGDLSLLSDGLQEALTRAMAAVTPEVELLEPKFTAGGEEVDQARVQELLDQAAEIAGLTATGQAKTLDGGTIALQYEVVTGDNLSQIAKDAGVTLDALKEANPELFAKNGSWDLVYSGDLVYIPQPSTDTEALQTAADTIENDMETSMDDTFATYEGGTTGQSIVDGVADSVEKADRAPLDANVQELRDYTEKAVRTKFAQEPITATVTAHINVLPDMTYLNTGLKSIGGVGVNRTMKYAEGGLVEGAAFRMTGEDGPEMIIPLSSSYRDRGTELWEQAGKLLGLNSTGATFSPLAATAPTNQGTSGVTAPVTVTVNPVFQVDAGNGDGQSVVTTIREHLEELVSEVANEIGKQVEQTMGNLPLMEV